MSAWLEEGESVVLEDRRSGRLEGRLRAFTGVIVATDRRLVFLERPRWAYAFGLLGLLLTKPTERRVAAAFADIASAGVGSHGRARTLEIELTSGESHRLLVKDPEAWLAAIGHQSAQRAVA